MNNTLGSLPTWLTFLSIVGVGWVVLRGSGGQAVEILQAANHVLSEQVKKLTDQNEQQAKQIAVLQTKTDVALALKPIMESIERHEARAEVRSEAMISALSRIAPERGVH